MGRPRYRRTPNENPAMPMPVVLPMVEFTVRLDGTMTVTVDGTPHEPERFAPPWRRDSFPAIIDTLTDQRRKPIRVVVREADGTSFTDIIATGRHRVDPETSPQARAAQPESPVLYLQTGDGFVPGEDVAVAIIVGHSDAAPDGTVRGLLTPEQLAGSPTGEVILLGRVSGTLTIGHPQ